MEENWKVIPAYPNYSVSDLGRVKNNRTNYILSQDTINGYRRVVLSPNKKTVNKRVHRLVLETFHPIPEMELYDVNHIDRDKNNNALSNLEWCTRSENLYWKEMPDNPNRSSKKVKVEYEDGTTEVYDSLTKCAQHFNVCPETIRGYILSTLTPKRTIQAKFSYDT